MFCKPFTSPPPITTRVKPRPMTTTVTLKCGGDPYSKYHRSFHVFKSTLTTSNSILKGVHKTFKLKKQQEFRVNSMAKTTEHQNFLRRYRSILRLPSKTVPSWLYSQLYNIKEKQASQNFKQPILFLHDCHCPAQNRLSLYGILQQHFK